MKIPENKESDRKEILPIVFLALLIVMFLSVCVVRAVYVMATRLNMSNPVIEYIIKANNLEKDVIDYRKKTGAADNNNANAETVKTVAIDWAEEYPFEGTATADETKPVEKPVSKREQYLNQYTDKASKIKSDIHQDCTTRLTGYDEIVSCARRYENAVGNYTGYTEYNGIMKLSDGYLTSFLAEASDENLDTLSDKVIGLKKFCEENGEDFLYVQPPFKVSEYQDTDISGSVDFSNQNADAFLSKLKTDGTDVKDLRQDIADAGYNNHKLFYRTDHHWLSTTGIWAAKKIFERLNTNYGYGIDTSLADSDRFNYKVYKNYFLGSQGKKVTLAETTPDDFTYYYPKYDTDFHFEVPARGVDADGDYQIIYDTSQLGDADYYGKNPYAAFNYGDQPLIKITNRNSTVDKKILFIHDSFGDCVLSNLALGVRYVDSIDLRYFNGSLKTYIRENKPDIVIVMYSAGAYNSVEDEDQSHTWLFDFE